MSRSTYYSRANSYSRSFNAEVAEDEGRLPLSRAKVEVAAQFGCSQSVAKVALEMIYSGEWHHVAKYANQVAYYDTTDSRLGGIIHEITRRGGAKKFTARRESLKQSRTGEPRRSRETNRIVDAAARRSIVREYFLAALGREIAIPVDARKKMFELWIEGDNSEDCVARRALSVGWSADAVLVALCSGHWEFCYRGHEAAAAEIISRNLNFIREKTR